MDYRRRYLKKLANKSRDNQNEEIINVNKLEEKNSPSKAEEKPNIKNIYLQKLLVRTGNSPSSSLKSIPSVTSGLSTFATNYKEVIPSEENKQKIIKYAIHKRTDENFGTRSPSNNLKLQEESSPSFSNKYFKNSRNTTTEKNNPYYNSNQTNGDSKNSYPQFYIRKNKNYSNFQEENNNQENKNEDNNKKEYNYNTYIKKRFQVSSSATNITNNNDHKDEVNNRSLYFRRYKLNNAKVFDNTENDNKVISKDKIEKTHMKYKYFRGSDNRNENEKTEENKSKEKVNNTIPVKQNSGFNFIYGKNEEKKNYDIKVNRKRSKDYEDRFKINEIVTPTINKRYTYVRQKYKKGENSQEKDKSNKDAIKNLYIKENVIDFKILSISANEANPNSRYKRKYCRFSSHNSENSTNENLSFKDENEIINYISKKYEQNKILELFQIKNKKKEEEIINLKEKLNEEIKKNKDKEKNFKKLENNITEKNTDIVKKTKDINNKTKEIEQLKNDITYYKKELQNKIIENSDLKNKIKKDGNNKSIKEELEKIKNEYNEVIRENERLVKDNDELIKENNLNKKDYNDLLKDYEYLQNNKTDNHNNEELVKIKKEFQQILEEKEKINKENILNKQKNDELQKLLRSIKEGNEQIEKSIKNNEKQNAQNNNLKKENDKLAKEIVDLKDEFKKNIEELIKMKKENDNLKNEFNKLNNLNNKAKNENNKIKEELLNSFNSIEENNKQNQDLLKIKEKYYKLLDDYKLLTEDCNLLRDEKSLIQLEQKKLMLDYKRSKEGNIKLQDDYHKLKEDYEQLLKNMESLKNNKTTNLEKLNNLDNNNIISKSNKKECLEEEKNNESGITNSIELQTIKKLDFDLKNEENKSEIDKINNNINNIINKISNKINNNNDIDINSKNNNQDIFAYKGVSEALNINSNKIPKVAGISRELENNLQKKVDTFTQEGIKDTEIIYDKMDINNDNFINVLNNQQLSKSVKKKKITKTFVDDDNEK